MTATLEALAQRRGEPSPVVMTTDGAAWSWPDLFTQFAPDIHSFARSRGSASPEDIVQDVFAAAVERFPRFEGDSSGLRSFLFTLAYRRVADEHRARYRRPEQLVADHHPTPDHGADIEEGLTTQEDADEAMRALDILNSRERSVIEMRIIDEASPAEVAQKLGLSNGNVRVIQARALMKIRKYLTARSGALPSFGLVFAFLKGLRSELPSEGGLAAWIETLRSEPTQDSLKGAAAAAGSAVAIEAATAGTIAATLLKLGLVVAVTTASASLAVTAIADDHQPDGPQHPAALTFALPAGTPETSGASTPPATFVDERISDADTATIDPNAPTQSSEGASSAGSADDSSINNGSNADLDGEATTLVDPLVEEVVEPLVGTLVDTVDAVVDDVVEPVVEFVVEDVVEPVVDVVVEDVVDDVVVNGVVEPVVEDVVQPVVDDTVIPVVEDTTQAVDETVGTVVDDLTDGLGLDDENPLGGLFG